MEPAGRLEIWDTCQVAVADNNQEDSGVVARSDDVGIPIHIWRTFLVRGFPHLTLKAAMVDQAMSVLRWLLLQWCRNVTGLLLHSVVKA